MASHAKKSKNSTDKAPVMRCKACNRPFNPRAGSGSLMDVIACSLTCRERLITTQVA